MSAIALASGTRLGPYEIVSPLGAGGMGEVYTARDTRLDRRVAIKISKEQFSERFENHRWVYNDIANCAFHRLVKSTLKNRSYFFATPMTAIVEFAMARFTDVCSPAATAAH